MKIFELDQAATMAPPAMPGQTPPPQVTSAAPASDPQAMAKAEANRKKQVQVQRKQIQDQIRAIDAQKAQLQKQLQSVK